MKRERRYIVIKVNDAREALSQNGLDRLAEIEALVALYREEAGKIPLECVVVESDWPEYEPVWKMIEQRVDGEKEKTK